MPRIGEVVYKVCLVEDDPNSRELLVHGMRSCKGLQLAGAYSSGEEALKELPKVAPDVVLMDIKMPGMSGIECTVALRHLSVPCISCVLMLTEYEDDDLIIEALKAGADGYLSKRHTQSKELQAAILEVMMGGGPMSQGIARRLIGSFHHPNNASPSSSAVSTTPPLTVREQEVLKFAIQGLAYKEVAGHLDISVNTVRNHFRSIYYKLHIHSRCDPRLYSLSRQYMDRCGH